MNQALGTNASPNRDPDVRPNMLVQRGNMDILDDLPNRRHTHSVEHQFVHQPEGIIEGNAVTPHRRSTRPLAHPAESRLVERCAVAARRTRPSTAWTAGPAPRGCEHAPAGGSGAAKPRRTNPRVATIGDMRGTASGSTGIGISDTPRGWRTCPTSTRNHRRHTAR